MDIHIPTMILAIVTVSLTLAVAVALVSHRDQRDGLRLWAGGLTVFSIAYALMALRDQVSVLVSVVLVNVLLSVTFALLAEGLYQFQQRMPSRSLLWLPVLVMAVAAWWARDDPPARVVVNALVIIVQCLMMGRVLLEQRGQLVGRGWYFFLGGLTLMVLTLLARVLTIARGDVEITSLFSPNRMQSLTFLVAMVSDVLLSLGLVLMGKEQTDERNRQLVMHDELTGLGSRRYVLECLSRQLLQSRRTGYPLTVLMLDIDHFKRVNDLYGHLSGDRALKAVATCLTGRLRGQDVAGRFGGEEFLMVLPHTDAAGGRVVAENLRRTIAAHHVTSLDGREMPITVSIGVYQHVLAGEQEAEGVIGCVDEVMYVAKRNGRNRVEVARSPVTTPAELAA